MHKLNNVLIIAFLIFISFLVRILFLEAPLQSDDTSYFYMASTYNFAYIEKAANQLWFRSGILLPLQFIQICFGYSIYTYYIMPILIFILMLIAVSVLCRNIENAKFAAYSILVISTSSHILINTSNILPDLPNAVGIIFSFVLFAYACKAKGIRHWLFILLASIFGFYSYTARLPSTIALICIPLYEALITKRITNTAKYAIVFLIFILVEMLFYSITAQNPLVRFQTFSKGVTLWTAYMTPLSLEYFLLEPFRMFLSMSSGKILLLGGAIGLSIALYKKNWTLVSFSVSGLMIFVLYSFSIQSLNPIVRALPLKYRYIILFSIVLCIATAYFLVNLEQYLENRTKSGWLPKLALLPLAAILIFQIYELPTALPNSILLGNDAYFVADRLAKSKTTSIGNKTIVYAHPLKDFKLYPNFSKLNLRTIVHSTSHLKPGRLYLFSKDRFKKDYYYAVKRKDIKRINSIKPFITPYNPNFEYIIDTGEIILAEYIGNKKLPTLNEIADFADYDQLGKLWFSSNPDVLISRDGNYKTKLHIARHSKPYYIYTVKGPFARPPKSEKLRFIKGVSGNIVNTKLMYEVDKNIKLLSLVIQQYDNKSRIESKSYALPSSSGKHIFQEDIDILTNTSSIRFYFRITADTDSSITLNKMTISEFVTDSSS